MANSILHMKASPILRIHADCPYCNFTGEVVAAEGWYDNQWNRGKGGFRITCPSCCKPYVIEQAQTHDLQHLALVILGEAQAEAYLPPEPEPTAPPKPLTMAEADAVAERTADAFSWDTYGESGWRASCRMLARRGYSAREIEAIMRSKWTRWAGDHASKSDRVNSQDLARFIDASYADPVKRAAEVAELVAGTFCGVGD
jgi:hypothetical protein